MTPKAEIEALQKAIVHLEGRLYRREKHNSQLRKTNNRLHRENQVLKNELEALSEEGVNVPTLVGRHTRSTRIDRMFQIAVLCAIAISILSSCPV